KIPLLPFLIWAFVLTSVAFGAAPNEALLKAKKEAESNGYTFVTSRDEILARAKKEGRLRAVSGISGSALKPMVEAFRKKYPFIDCEVVEIEGTAAYQRFLLELKAGTSKRWDSTYLPYDNYKAFLAYQMKFDILGMVKAGVLNIHPRMVDPVNRNTVSANTIASVAVYNRKLITEEKVPSKWEDFLKAEFKGRKIAADIRPSSVAALVPTWGLEPTLEFARKFSAQEPIWVTGGTRAITVVQSGEAPLGLAVQQSSIKRVLAKDPANIMGYKIVEPVPIRVVSRIDGVLQMAENPHAALLWLEFQATPEGQKVLEDYGPFQASVFTPGSAIEKETRGKKLSEVDWDQLAKLDEYEAKIIEAYGFPRAK
ncbi:MAG TPA: extracellular solute-binding protein, partial [Candidatus Limnocylindrales bacterium]|nr:extracellular solute-binding protein [Candidatus Limnocylindrales bacterium]